MMTSTNLALVGTTGIGKSAVLEDLIFNVYPTVKQNFVIFQVPLSHNSTCTKLQEYFEERLSQRYVPG